LPLGDVGEVICAIAGNNDFIDLPPVVKREQGRGKQSAEEIDKLHSQNECVYRALPGEIAEVQTSTRAMCHESVSIPRSFRLRPV
jgi:hypothetical protein